MARTVRDPTLDTRTARSRLPQRHKPFWRRIDRRCHLGYYRGKRGGTWVARYRLDDGKYAEKRIGTADDVQDADGVLVLSFTQAQAKARNWFSEQARKEAGEEDDEPSSYTVAAAMEDYLYWYERENKASGYRSTKTTVSTHILPELGDIEVAKLTMARIEDWHHGLAATPLRVRPARGKPAAFGAPPEDGDDDARRRRKSTANRILTVLKAGLNRARRMKRLQVPSAEAWREVKAFKGADAPKIRYLTAAECTRLVNACAPDFRLLVQAALLTGCRYGELIALRVDDYNPDSGTVTIREAKAGKPRHIPLNAAGVTFFERTAAGRRGDERMLVRADGEAWGRSQQGRRFNDAAKAAKILGASFHSLRHSYGSALAMEGVPMGVIAVALGHSDSRLTEKFYAHLAPSYVADTIRANLPTLGVVESDTVTPLRK